MNVLTFSCNVAEIAVPF